MRGPALALSGSNVTGDVPFSCALRLDGVVVEARSPAGARGDLAMLVADLCAQHAVRPDQVTELRIDLGPGSYTGLRVAVTFVRFLQHFGAVPVLAVGSLALLATSVLGVLPRGRRLRPLLDARRGRFHTGLLSHSAAGGLVILEEPRALPFAEVLAATVAGDLVVLSAAVEAQVGADLRRAGAEIHVASGVAAKDLFLPALPFVACASEALEPRYLMGTYADD